MWKGCPGINLNPKYWIRHTNCYLQISNTYFNIYHYINI